MIPDNHLSDLIEGYKYVLQQDGTWHGDLTDEERNILIDAFCHILKLRCERFACMFEDEQTRILMTLRVYANMAPKLSA